MTISAAEASAFYSAVLGVESAKMPGPVDYTLLRVGGTDVAGIMEITEQMGPIPPNWMVYFAVADVDASAAQAQSLGANILAPPMDIPGMGRFASLMDPQGAAFSVFKHAEGG